MKFLSRDGLNMKYLKENGHHTNSDELGQVNYYDIVVNDKVLKNGAWYYPDFKLHSREFKDFVTFSKDVNLSIV